MDSNNTEPQWKPYPGDNFDYDLVKEWMQQESPAVETLTEDDVWNAYIAQDVINNWRADTNWDRFEMDRTLAGWEASTPGGKPWSEVMGMVQRGIAVLNGYLLITNRRVPVWNKAPQHDEAIVSRQIGGGYRAMEEMHRTMSLVKADDLITISTAAEILYGENTQSKRVMVVEDMSEGYLQTFTDRSEPNPQKSKRVSKRQVLVLLYQRKGD